MTAFSSAQSFDLLVSFAIFGFGLFFGFQLGYCVAKGDKK